MLSRATRSSTRAAILTAALLAIAATSCGTSDQNASGPAASTSTAPGTTAVRDTGTRAPNDTTTATSLSFETVPDSQATADPAASGSILMVKLNVGDVAQAEKFYGTVFGAKVAAQMGTNVHIVTFPAGGPGLVLIKSTDTNKQGAFIIKVPNLETAKAAALANGATEQGTFAGNPSGQAARSVDLLDPWNNQVEILQLGG